VESEAAASVLHRTAFRPGSPVDNKGAAHRNLRKRRISQAWLTVSNASCLRCLTCSVS
jgi:hypothetical protein